MQCKQNSSFLSNVLSSSVNNKKIKSLAAVGYVIFSHSISFKGQHINVLRQETRSVEQRKIPVNTMIVKL